jgi:hypothetical protein
MLTLYKESVTERKIAVSIQSNLINVASSAMLLRVSGASRASVYEAQASFYF